MKTKDLINNIHEKEINSELLNIDFLNTEIVFRDSDYKNYDIKDMNIVYRGGKYILLIDLKSQHIWKSIE